MGIPFNSLPLNVVQRMGFEPNRKLAKEYNNKRESVCIDGKTCHFRSQLEKEFAHYLQMLKDSGHIKDWAYEQTTFRFPDSSYLVDFDVLNIDGSFEYYECKGLFEADTRRKIKLLNKYRPEVKLTLVFRKRSDARPVSKKVAGMLKRVCIFKGFCHGLTDYDFGY